MIVYFHFHSFKFFISYLQCMKIQDHFVFLLCYYFEIILVISGRFSKYYYQNLLVFHFYYKNFYCTELSLLKKSFCTLLHNTILLLFHASSHISEIFNTRLFVMSSFCIFYVFSKFLLFIYFGFSLSYEMLHIWQSSIVYLCLRYDVYKLIGNCVPGRTLSLPEG